MHGQAYLRKGMRSEERRVGKECRSGINTIHYEQNPLFTINVTMRDIKSKNVYSRVNSKDTTQWRKTESANGVHLEGVAFFFSSRRRHTRLTCDWSSDVCSSDLSASRAGRALTRRHSYARAGVLAERH